MAPTRVILMSCGSYNPPTNMHLRMFEIARDHLHRMGTYTVVGAVISPTHDDYAKKELASSEHRCAMLKLATQNSDWIRVSTWETRQNGWTKTKLSLQHHQNMLNSVLLDANYMKHCNETDETDWIPENIKNSDDRTPIQIQLLCGADLLESFGTPGLWADEDIDAIVGQHGLVVITREGSNPNKFIYDSDILSKYMHNIHIVTEWIPNEVSSTKIRRALKRGESVRYLVQDSVIEYVYKHGIYEAKTVSTIKLELSAKNDNDYLSIQPKYESNFLTPSPSDVTMTTPSPVDVISIDISETVLKKNYQNYPINSRTNFSITTDDSDERMGEKFNSFATENAGKSLGINRVTYPGQAKQIIANESGESQIFCEVGLSCISENCNVEMEIDGKIREIVDKDDCQTVETRDNETNENEDCIAIFNDESPSELLVPLRTSEERALTPDDSESKISVILSINVIDASSLETRDDSSKNKLPASCPNDEGFIDNVTKDAKENVTIATSNESSEILLSANDEKTEIIVNAESSVSGYVRESFESPKAKSLDTSTNEKVSSSISEIEDCMEKSLLSTSKLDSSENNSTIEESATKREGNIEIDGRYLKSVVNSRKSPKKVKNEDSSIVLASMTISSDAKIVETFDDKIAADVSSSKSVAASRTEMMIKDVKTTGRKRGVVFQGSLDSINVKQPKSSSSNSTNNHPPISKKSKSYEFIKFTESQPTLIYKIPLTDANNENPTSRDEESMTMRSDDNSISRINETRETGGNDEFCSVCCCTNEQSSNEAFHSLGSNESSPLEEASTECDICSNCDLREDRSNEKLSFKPILADEPVCELCEICGDSAMDEDVVASSLPVNDDIVERRLLVSRQLPLSLPKTKRPIVRLSSRNFVDIDREDAKNDVDEDEPDADNFDPDATDLSRKIADSREKLKGLHDKTNDENFSDDTSSNDDEFEIENCGLEPPEHDNDNGNDENSRYKNEIEDTLRNIVPRDEIAMSSKNSKKIIRAGSLINRDTIDRTRAKRRYSSVDNLQNSRQNVKSTLDKQNSLRSRNIVRGLVASADNIRPVRNSRTRNTTLRKSADDVGRDCHSSLVDSLESPVYENIDRKKMSSVETVRQKSRDSGTIKMILTKHGIKIISDKETAL